MCGINFEELDTAANEVERLAEVDGCDWGGCCCTCCCSACGGGGAVGGRGETVVLACGISVRDTSQQLEVNARVVRGVLAVGHMQ